VYANAVKVGSSTASPVQTSTTVWMSLATLILTEPVLTPLPLAVVMNALECEEVPYNYHGWDGVRYYRVPVDGTN
jgi:hypothetical protein